MASPAPNPSLSRTPWVITNEFKLLAGVLHPEAPPSSRPLSQSSVTLSTVWHAESRSEYSQVTKPEDSGTVFEAPVQNFCGDFFV